MAGPPAEAASRQTSSLPSRLPLRPPRRAAEQPAAYDCQDRAGLREEGESRRSGRVAWHGQNAGGRRRTRGRSPGEGFASEIRICNSFLLFNENRTTEAKTYSLTSYEKPLSPTRAASLSAGRHCGHWHRPEWHSECLRRGPLHPRRKVPDAPRAAFSSHSVWAGPARPDTPVSHQPLLRMNLTLERTGVNLVLEEPAHHTGPVTMGEENPEFFYGLNVILS